MNLVAVNNEGITENSTASAESATLVNSNQNLPESCAGAQEGSVILLSEQNESWNQTDSSRQGNQGMISPNLKTVNGKENVPNITISENNNGRDDKLMDSKCPENLEMPSRRDGNEDEKTKIQTKDDVPENLHKQEDAEGTTKLPELNSDQNNSGLVNKEEQNNLKVPVSLSVKEFDNGVDLRPKNREPIGETCQIPDTNKEELDKKMENAATFAKQDAPQNYTVSIDFKPKWDKSNPTGKVPETFLPNCQKPDSDNLKPGLPLVSTPSNSKICQNLNDSKEVIEQTENSKNTFAPSTQPVTITNSGEAHECHTENNVKMFNRMSNPTLNVSKQCPDLNSPQALTTYSVLKKSSVSVLSQIPTDRSTRSQSTPLGQSLISGENLSELNKTLSPAIQRKGDESTSFQMGRAVYLGNSGRAPSQNKSLNEMKPTTSVHQYNTNLNKTSTNKSPSNVITTCSKSIPSNFKATNLIHPGIQNMPEHLNQSSAQPLRLSNVPKSKETLEAESRFSFPTAPAINSGFSHNQRTCYARYDASSMQYVFYPDNSNIRRHMCNRTKPTAASIANNNALPTERPGVFAAQSTQKNVTHFGSPYLLMWPQRGDQTTGADKLTIAQQYSTQGLLSTYQQAPKNSHSNPVNGSNLYSIPSSTNDTNLYKNQFSNRGLNLLAGQPNPGEKSNSAVSNDAISKHQEILQNVPGTYNTIRQPLPSHQNDMFLNRENNISFPVSQNSIQRGQLSGHQYYQPHVSQNGDELKVRLSNSSHSNLPFLNQNQVNSSNFYSSYDQYQELKHYSQGIPVPNTQGYSRPNPIPPAKTQNMYSSNSHNGHTQRLASSISSTSNPVIPTFQGQIKTATTTTTATSTSSLTKEVQKNADSSNRKGPLPDTGQHSGLQRSQNNIPELGVAHQSHALTKYPTQPSISNSSKIGTRFPPADAYQNRPISSKDAHAIDANKDQMSYSPNNSNGILTWSQYYPQSFNPTRPVNPSQRVTSDYNPVQEERNVTELNFQLQGNMHSHYYASQSYNNYTQQHLPPSNTSQETSNLQNTSNSIPTSSNAATTYNASATGQDFDRFRVDNHDGGDKAENCKYFQEIATSMAGDQATWKVEMPDKNMKFPVQCSETGASKLASGEKFQNYNSANDLCPKVRERTADLGKSTQVLTPTTAASTSTTSCDLLTNALCHPNLGMTSEELFLFSDFDPLFTSSLLTNDLDYFPENNSAFDQCFEDAASLTMAMISSREAQAPQNLDPVDPGHTNLTSQQQLTPLSNILDDKSMPSLTNIPLPQMHYNQIPPTRTYYTTGVGDDKNLAPFANQPNESLLGYFPGAGISTPSSKIGLGVARPIDGYPDDSILKRFSDLCTSKTASQLAKPINDYKSGKKWVNKRGLNLDDDANGTAIKKRNRQKKDHSLTGLLPEEEAAKKLKKKTPILKGPPRPRGRPPKNKSLGNTAFAPTQNLAPQFSVNDANYTNQTGSLDIVTGTLGVKLPEQMVEFPKQISMSSPAVTLESKQNAKNTFGKSSTEPEVRVDLENRKNPAESDKSSKDSSNESCLVSKETSGNPSSITKAQRELSDREVIDAVTKCLESISRSEEKENSDQMKEFQFDARSENADSALDSSVIAGMDTESGKDGVSQEDQALSREEMLMKAYMELKMKLEERMSRSLWRQSYLKRQKPKNGKAFQKLSKKECMTPYSGSTTWGPDDDLFTRYSNRSTNNSTKLVATADSTSTSIDSNYKQTETSNESKSEVMNVKVSENLEVVEEPKSVVNDQLITSTELPGHKDETVTTGATLRLPSMMEVVRTRLADDLPSVDRSLARSLAPEAPITRPECTIQTGNVPSENFELIEKSRNREGIDSKESEQAENTDNTAADNRQPQKLPATSRYSVQQPYFSSPLLPLPPPPPLPPQITHFPSNREKKVNPRKVGPTIVENARICFEAIGKYLTKADSDFDSFLISYANIVQGLLNCGAERYGRIKAILINRSETESEELTPENKKTSDHTALHFDSQGSEDQFEFHPDIDASDIQGNSGSGENTIDVDDFSSNYAEIVKIILSSRADEYRNIKQALSRNICGGMDVCQGPAKSTGKIKSDCDVGNELSLPTPTDCEEANGPPLPKAERKHGKKTQCETSKDPSQVLKKRRKRKTHAEKDSARLKNKVVYNNETYAMETDCEQTTNRKLDILKSPSKWKHCSSSNSTNSSGFRIILSSNYFVEQSRNVSNLPVKSRKSEISIEEDQEETESRRPLSSDDGFVEESTGDYVIGLGSESGDDEKLSSVFREGPFSEVDKQTDGTSKNPHSIQSKPLDKPATCWENGFEIESNDYSSDFNLNEETICEAVITGGDPETTVESLNEINTMSSVSTEKQEENKRRRPSRKAASAGIGATRCSCGCCDDSSDLKEKTVEKQLRDLTMSFKNRNRSKIIKPKRACIPKKRGRPRKIDKCPQKIISKFWTDTGVTEEESRDTAKILDDCDEPSRLKMPEELDEQPSVANVSFKQSSMRTNTVSDLSGRQDFYVHPNSDSDEFSDSELIMGGLGDSDDSWKPKKSNKKIKRGTLKKKKGRDLATCHLFQSIAKAPLIGVYDSRPDGNDQQKAEECQARKSESSSEEDESCTKKNSLTRNEASKSTTVTGWASSPKEFNRDGKVSKTRISFKDFVPNLKIPPLPKTPIHNTEASKELNISSEIPNSDSDQTIKEVSKFFTRDVSNNKSEPLESSKSFNQEQKRIALSKKDGGRCSSSNNAICVNQTEVRAKHQCNQSDTNLQTKADDNGDQSDISKEGYLERIQAENGTEASQTPKETNSSEERLRSLIEKITEINAATKRLDTVCSVSVESGSENIEKDSNGEITQSLDGGFGSIDCKGMKVKTELLEGIDETIRCPIGTNDSDNSSSNSSRRSNSGESSEEENQRRVPMDECQGLSRIFEVKMPSPLNSRKKKPSRTFKIEQVGFENKIIIRKSCLAKEKKRHRNRKKPARKEKNIFDIMSQDEDEDEERGIVGREIKREPERNLDDLPCPQSKKGQSPSITSGVSKSDKSQRPKTDGKSTMSRGIKQDVTTNLAEILDSHVGKLSILSQTERSESSPGFSNSVKNLTEIGVEVPKIKKRKRIKTNQSFLTEAKIHLHSEDERFSDSVSYSKTCHTNLMQEPKITVDDSLLIKVGETGSSKPKTKKRKKKSETDLDVFNSKDDKVYFPFDMQKVKKRKKSLDPENDLALPADRKVGNKEKLIISGALRRNRQTIDGSSSDQDFATPLKTEGSLRAGDECNSKQKLSKRPAVDRPPLQCSYCSKSFKKPSELLYHTRNHTGVRPFLCDQCDKSFVSNAHLLRHKRTHSSERRHVCPTCGRGFTQHYGMLVHQLIHSGLKPHKCPDCSREFRTKGSLGTHRRKHHPKQVAKEKEAQLPKDPQD